MAALSLQQTADANQAKASDPEASVWVSANAGTGKTAVLVNRVLRLLLAGASPESILCLTYTKTAAAEMANRLLKRLASWTALSDDDLIKDLTRLMGREPAATERAAARRLFACTLEAKGGLKIHTIHGFCERILQRFPLEAGITPNFEILDDQEQKRLLDTAFTTVLGQAARDSQAPLGAALSRIALREAEQSVQKLIAEALHKRREILRIQGLYGARENWTAREGEALRALFGLGADANEASLLAEAQDAIPQALVETILETLSPVATSKTEVDLLQLLQDVRSASSEMRIAASRALVYTSSGIRKRLFTKAVTETYPELCEGLREAILRFAAIDADIGKIACADGTAALLLLADAVAQDYEARKRARAVLDYDDLIETTLTLFERSMAAPWVLFKLDGGIDHILVDEAQDTNAAQWRIVEALAEEFFSGKGAKETPRTLFAVGDEKQSIYSFQGAEPACFGEYGRKFAVRVKDAGQVWHHLPLTLSFRSTEAVLAAVDDVFAQTEAAKGLTWQQETVIQHSAFRTGEAGLVELWETEQQEEPPLVPAFEPWNEAKATRAAVEALAERIARTIRGWLDNGEILASEGRPIRAGDVLILVRRRAHFVTPMIRWLKRLNIPVAGADRMRLLEQAAIQDLVALADTLLMPEDDLALAVTLKSPFFGLSDDDLFDLAYDREGSLWAALRAHAAEPRFAEAAETLEGWLSRTDFLPPYEFFAEVLGAEGQKMRKRLLTRLGPEAAEAIDEMMELALHHDGEEAPSLQGFIHQLRSGDIEIKRDMEQARDEVRIMTVHGAKGLQAPIVFLPDHCEAPKSPRKLIFEAPRKSDRPDAPPHLIWPAGAKEIEALKDAQAAVKDAEIEERHRLLYVALTRARDRLYVCGWGKPKEGNGSWYDLVRSGLLGTLQETETEDGRIVHRLVSEQTKQVAPAEAREGEAAPETLPDWAMRAPPAEHAPKPVTPSSMPLEAEEPEAGGLGFEPAALGPTSLSTDNRFLRGRLIHALLEHLPDVAPDNRQAAAMRYIAAKGAGMPGEMRQEIVAEALRIANDPQFAPYFAADSLPEVPVVARIGEGDGAYELNGQIDRLAILEEGLFVLDYKTNRPPPLAVEDVAPIYIAQLAAYRIALKGLFPGQKIRCGLLWTDRPALMEIPEEILERAERKMLQRSQP
ncbi:double-strand break repair helicase AddA [Methyloligella sp. 2.7D]|uniref:double-strand break repair helicase AddA n=1 Tax=unclassified Methyloligella TaxID=2625955 RepID=UPI00157DE409|nr:double-strand break repair helicase AddA [Methyloligella sp. GL2]QKP76058.1 double-strand break repair helicase AddA [Methyloligella sp. GL2]